MLKRRWWLKIAEIKHQYIKKMRLEQPGYPFIYVPKLNKLLPRLTKLRGKHNKNKEQVRMYFSNRRRIAWCRRTGKPLDYLEVYLPCIFNDKPRILNDSWVSKKVKIPTLIENIQMPPRRTGIFSKR